MQKCHSDLFPLGWKENEHEKHVNIEWLSTMEFSSPAKNPSFFPGHGAHPLCALCVLAALGLGSESTSSTFARWIKTWSYVHDSLLLCKLVWTFAWKMKVFCLSLLESVLSSQAWGHCIEEYRPEMWQDLSYCVIGKALSQISVSKDSLLQHTTQRGWGKASGHDLLCNSVSSSTAFLRAGMAILNGFWLRGRSELCI